MRKPTCRVVVDDDDDDDDDDAPGSANGARDEGTEQAKGNNPRAFIFKSSSKARKARTVAAEKQQRKLRAPIMDRTGDEPPPFVVLVQGPPGCGKSTVIKSLVKHYTRHALSEVKGPITVVSGKKRRIQFIEVRNDLNDMVDAAKMADLVLLLVDGSYGGCQRFLLRARRGRGGEAHGPG